jgi:hypothetical protein
MATGDNNEFGGKPAPRLVHQIFIDAERGVVHSKNYPAVLRPRDGIRWVARKPFEIRFLGRSAAAKAAQASLKSTDQKGIFSIEFSDPGATKFTTLDYEVRVGGKCIDPTIIIDPAAVVLLG